MIRQVTYFICITCIFAMVMSSCGNRLNKRVTLWRNDKIPYGTWYAYNHLDYIFTKATIKASDKSPVTFFDSDENSSAYIIIGHTVKPDNEELRAILNYAIAGNHVFISALDIGQNILDSFNLDVNYSGRYVFRPDSMTIGLLHPLNYDSMSFTYPGIPLENSFSEMDSSVTNILGKDAEGNANFVKFTYEGGGTVVIHLAPGAFTNFFLLHRKNKEYYDLALSSIPDTVSTVRWDDYYRHHIDGNDNAEKSAFSKLDTFLKNDMLRWAFWLTVILFAIVYLVESKRKQRAIPVLARHDNTSLDFVKTIGRLYFQRKDNKNLSTKMATHFLGHVRTRYNIPTSQLNAEFEEKLAYKSGYPLQLVKEIIEMIKLLEASYEVSDEDLLLFNEKINTFINKA